MIKDEIIKNANVDTNEEKVKAIAKIFPNAVINGKVDFVVLEKELNPDFLIKEGYELNFLGKSYAKFISATGTETVIIPDVENNTKTENAYSENLYLSADNLDALKHLLKSYHNKIRSIYIDPPYNTGSDGFVYNDGFNFTKESIVNDLSVSEDEAERILNMISNGNSSHSAWLTFMYPRLYLARQLLKENGFIFVSIDENELFNLKILLDQIFGESNFVSMFAVENNPKGRKNSKFVAVSNDYCIVYAKNAEDDQTYFLENIPKNINDLNEDEDGNFVHNSGKRVLVGENKFNRLVTNFESKKHYSVYRKQNEIQLIQETMLNEINSELIREGYERFCSYRDNEFVENTYSREQFINLFNNKRLEFKNGKIYEKNLNTTIRIKSILANKEYIGVEQNEEKTIKLDYKTTSAGTYLKKLFGDKKVFSNPKPIGLLKTLLTLIDDKEAIILDFFSGSGTTADAVQQLNLEDNGTRKFIAIQLPENLDEALLKSSGEAKTIIENAIEVCDSINRPHTLDWVGMERIIRSNKIRGQFSEGFKHYTISSISSNQLQQLEDFNPEILFTDNNILEEFGVDTVLTTWINYDGYGLTKSANKLELCGYTAYQIENTVYFLNDSLRDDAIKCFIEKYEDDTFVCNKFILFGYSFTMNEIQTIKDNLKQIKNIKNISLEVEVRY